MIVTQLPPCTISSSITLPLCLSIIPASPSHCWTLDVDMFVMLYPYHFQGICCCIRELFGRVHSRSPATPCVERPKEALAMVLLK